MIHHRHIGAQVLEKRGFKAWGSTVKRRGKGTESVLGVLLNLRPELSKDGAFHEALAQHKASTLTVAAAAVAAAAAAAAPPPAALLPPPTTAARTATSGADARRATAAAAAAAAAAGGVPKWGQGRPAQERRAKPDSPPPAAAAAAAPLRAAAAVVEVDEDAFMVHAQPWLDLVDWLLQHGVVHAGQPQMALELLHATIVPHSLMPHLVLLLLRSVQ